MNYYKLKLIIVQTRKLVSVVLFMFFATNLFAQNDTLYSATGDVLVGEIKSLDKNVLTFDTDYADSDFKIEWKSVKGLISKTNVIVYTKSGERLVGYFSFDNNDKRMVKLTNSGVGKNLLLNEIVEIETLSSGFWSRIYISLDAGYSFTSANNLSQLSITGRVKYDAENWRLGAGFNNVVTNQDEVDATTRNEANIDFTRDILGKSFGFLGMEFLENSEQMLDLRTTSKLGLGYYFIRTNGLFLQGSAGIANANEKFGGTDPKTENSFEGLGAIEFDAFDIGDFSFRAKVSAYPSFSNKGRVRVNSDISLKWDLPLDFYIKASFIHNYDNKPLVENVENSDYVFQTSIGWEWD
jgi:hypothetical protein